MGSYAAAADIAGGTEATGGRRLRVLLLDAHDLVHLGFKAMLASERWVERFIAAHDPDQAVELAGRFAPQVAVIDLAAANGSLAELCERIRAASPGTRVLLMSAGERISARSAREAGASGFVSKRRGARDIASAARVVGLGMTTFETDGARTRSLLSEREREVLELVAAGATNREIAARLFLSPYTIKDHTSSLYRKLGARNRAEAIARAQRLGLLDQM